MFGAVGALWSLAFLFTVYEDPNHHPTINESERQYINDAVWGKVVEEVSVVHPHRVTQRRQRQTGSVY